MLRKHHVPTPPQIPTYPGGDFIDHLPPPRAEWLMGSLGLTLVAAGIVSGIASGGENQVSSQERLQAVFDGRKQEVHAVANRFEDCIVDGKITLQPKTAPGKGKHASRDSLGLTITTTRNEAGKTMEAKYADDDTVMWQSSVFGYMVKKDEAGHPTRGEWVDNAGPTGLAQISERPTNRTNLYPFSDLPAGSQMAVFTGTHAETTSFDLQKVYAETAGKYCATLTLSETTDGQRNWQVDPTAQALPDIHKVQNFDLVPSAVSPGVYSRQIAQ